MKVTIDSRDELMRRIRDLAEREGRPLKDVVADLLRRGLAADADDVASRATGAVETR